MVLRSKVVPLMVLLLVLKMSAVQCQTVRCGDAGDPQDTPQYGIFVELTYPSCAPQTANDPGRFSSMLRSTVASCLPAWQGIDEWVRDDSAAVVCQDTYKFALGVSPRLSRNDVKCLVGSAMDAIRACSKWKAPGGWPSKPLSAKVMAPDLIGPKCYINWDNALVCLPKHNFMFMAIIIVFCAGGVATVLVLWHSLRQQCAMRAMRRQLAQNLMAEEADAAAAAAKSLRELPVFIGTVIINPDEEQQVAIELDKDGRCVSTQLADLEEPGPGGAANAAANVSPFTAHVTSAAASVRGARAGATVPWVALHWRRMTRRTGRSAGRPVLMTVTVTNAAQPPPAFTAHVASSWPPVPTASLTTSTAAAQQTPAAAAYAASSQPPVPTASPATPSATAQPQLVLPLGYGLSAEAAEVHSAHAEMDKPSPSWSFTAHTHSAATHMPASPSMPTTVHHPLAQLGQQGFPTSRSSEISVTMDDDTMRAGLARARSDRS